MIGLKRNEGRVKNQISYRRELFQSPISFYRITKTIFLILEST